VQCYQHERESHHCCAHVKRYIISLVFYDYPPCSVDSDMHILRLCYMADGQTRAFELSNLLCSRGQLYSWLKNFSRLWNQNFHHSIHRIPTLDHSRACSIWFFIFTTCSTKNHFNINYLRIFKNWKYCMKT
jgi:hypothetical protein